ncbi:MAG: hypothetical protein MHMPM18_001297 [Marteilia pararefringens]
MATCLLAQRHENNWKSGENFVAIFASLINGVEHKASAQQHCSLLRAPRHSDRLRLSKLRRSDCHKCCANTLIPLIVIPHHLKQLLPLLLNTIRYSTSCTTQTHPLTHTSSSSRHLDP